MLVLAFLLLALPSLPHATTPVLDPAVLKAYLSPGRYAPGELKTLLTTLDQNLNNNPLTVAHANFFKGNKSGTFGRLYRIGRDAYSVPFTPAGLTYNASAAVGYGLANTMLISTPAGHIIVDTGSGPQDVLARIAAFQAAGVLPPGRGPFNFRAIIYTHNHIDHVGGVYAWLQNSTLPRCPAEQPENAGVDGTYYPRTNCVEIFGQQMITSGLVDTCTRSGNIIDERSAYMYGAFLNTSGNVDGTTGNLNCGIGPKESGGGFTYEAVSKTFTTWLQVHFNDVRLWLRYAPSETNDEAVVFLPDSVNSVGGGASRRVQGVHSHVRGTADADCATKQGITFPTAAPADPSALGSGLLLSAEVIQGPSFPNLYSLRGTTFRNPLTWYESVDLLRQFDSWGMVPSHGVPLMGKPNIATLLVNYRDAVQVVHDQTLRFARLGFVPDELVGLVRLPEYIFQNLASLVNGLPANEGMDPLDYLRTFYGSVPQGVREIYSGYLGWNEGDATLFMPLPPVERASRYVNAMGGAGAVIARAQAAYDLGKASGDKREFQWCAELLINVLGAGGPKATIDAARVLKAQAFLQLAQTASADVAVLQNDWWSLNPNWRNWLVTGALELLLQVDDLALPNIPDGGLIGPNAMRSVPPKDWVQQWCWRYNETGSAGIQGRRFGFDFYANVTYWGPQNQRFILDVQRSVVRLINTPSVVDAAWPSVDFIVGIPNWDAFSALVNRDAPTPANAFAIGLEELLNNGTLVRERGATAAIADFFSASHFDQINRIAPPIVGRHGPVTP